MFLPNTTFSTFIFSCIEATFPQPDIPFLENPNDDKDGDGFTENLGDCDDADADVNPFALGALRYNFTRRLR